MLWLDDRRGYLVDAITQAWARATGQRFDPREFPWLDGPVGGVRRIGSDFFERLAQQQGARVVDGQGLLESATSLLPENGARQLLSKDVAQFYERTNDYD